MKTLINKYFLEKTQIEQYLYKSLFIFTTDKKEGRLNMVLLSLWEYFLPTFSYFLLFLPLVLPSYF